MPSGDEVALMHALYEVGPISVAMDAGLKTFQVHACILYYMFNLVSLNAVLQERNIF